MNQTLVILDYGSQYTQLIARRARELGVYSIILPFTTSFPEIMEIKPQGIILSGGPNSVNDTKAPTIDNRLFVMGVPILGICYGMQLMATALGGKVEASPSREYGQATLAVNEKSWLFKGLPPKSIVWMSHGDHVAKLPPGFMATGRSGELLCAMEDTERQLFALQFHPEVNHTEYGQQILQRFLEVCAFRGDWSPSAFIATQLEDIKSTVGAGKVVCALSGGVDSSVAATLVNQAIGDQQTCIFVDNGVLRLNEFEEVLALYESIGLKVRPVRAANRFMTALKGVTDPESKRKIIGGLFIKIFEEEAKRIKDVDFLVQGTLYPDAIESVSVNGPSATIKSHHNVGGLPKKMQLKLIEPLRELFKDEVRLVGRELGLPDTITQRQPFPGPGLAVRIVGEVDKTNVKLLQEADAIVREEIENHPIRPEIWQFFAILLPIKAVGVMGDGRTYEQVVAIRAIQSSDGMTADWAKLPHDLLERISSRIVSEVKGVNRVVYDITSKPPGTIEWE